MRTCSPFGYFTVILWHRASDELRTGWAGNSVTYSHCEAEGVSETQLHNLENGGEEKQWNIWDLIHLLVAESARRPKCYIEINYARKTVSWLWCCGCFTPLCYEPTKSYVLRDWKYVTGKLVGDSCLVSTHISLNRSLMFSSSSSGHEIGQ